MIQAIQLSQQFYNTYDTEEALKSSRILASLVF
jgi:hypothetical protein